MCLNKTLVHFKYGWFIVRMIFPESGSVTEIRKRALTQPLLRKELHFFYFLWTLKTSLISTNDVQKYRCFKMTLNTIIMHTSLSSEFRYKVKIWENTSNRFLFSVKKGHVCNPPHTLGGALYHRFASRKLLSFRENQKAAWDLESVFCVIID